MKNENTLLIVALAALVFVILLGIFPMGYGMMGSYWFGYNLMWIFMILIWILIIVFLILGILWLLKQLKK